MSQLRTPRGYGHQNILGDRYWSLKATYVEIYNEQLRDLLVPETSPAHERGNIAIRENAKGNILLTGLHQVDIESVDDLMNALNFSSSIRQTDATAINAKSSRSHAVFSLNLVQRRSQLYATNCAEKRFSVPWGTMPGQDVSVTTDSKLHFVDLAGSERLKNTGAQGERAKEGISINAGLASLGKVISQLSSRQPGSHVSYRDSKLTRLLQDSLGGNAITYMIACVTPAEFHLSETLNTVQYAQRARAIQSKPRIQQVEESDKQAVIDRLRAEVSFLREQIRSASDGGGGGGGSPHRVTGATYDRSERQNEREVELQNQLLDVQENYNALGQRHAMLIAEMAKAREHESEEESGSKAGGFNGDSATDRLNRSNYFAQAVEQVVLEYEKTIQTLEQSLSNTRATLSSTETSLLEKETKCAYVETINNQLQSRLQKLMDREASTENYLHDLEAKLDGHTSGEEKNATIILELRKEIARARENEASCEDYISTLEERLAEADQDAELMQREIDRLEQVVERQRSLSKLDALLHELDHVDGAGKPGLVGGPNGFAPPDRPGDHPSGRSQASHQGQAGSPIPEGDERAVVASGRLQEHATAHREDAAAERAAVGGAQVDADDAAQSPAQSRLVADKLESVTQELVGLRVEHETTLNDLHEMHAKYEEAMRSLADLQQDAVDEARHPPRVRDSVLSAGSEAQAQAGPLSPLPKSPGGTDGPRSSVSRSLSSELSSAVESSASADTDATSEDGTATAKPAASSEDLTQPRDDALKAELHRLRWLSGEKEAAERELASKYAQLESRHNETLDMVEELKTEVSKARAVEATSPRQSTPVIRRKSSQNVMIMDRAHRSFALLRNIATENFEGQPEVMQNFELNLNTAIHELHSRSMRIQELEENVASTKKEMETKMTIISGLTRERSSLKATPMDMSIVATLREQLEKNEMQMRETREAHAARKKELAAEIEMLRGLSDGASATDEKGDETPVSAAEPSGADHGDKISELQSELSGWENKHKTVLESMRATEAELRHTVQQLEAQVVTLNANLVDSEARAGLDDSEAAKEADQKHHNLVEFLRTEIDEYKAVISSNATKVAELESSHAAARGEAEEMARAHGEATKEVSRYRELVAELEEKVAAHGEAIKARDEAVEQLKSDHARELAELQAREQKVFEEQAEVLVSEHAESVRKLESELAEARQDLVQVASKVALAMGSDVSIGALVDQMDDLVAARKADADVQRKAGEMEKRMTQLTQAKESTARDLETAKTALSVMLADEQGGGAATSITDQLSAVKGRMSELELKNKNSRLVEELEEQLQNNFDEVQMTNKRLSTLQTERNVQLEVTAARAKLQAELDSMREEYSCLQVRRRRGRQRGESRLTASAQAKYNEVTGPGDVNRSNSNSTIRKSASHTALPSPPPAIPLPPLPMAARSGSPTNGPPASPSSQSASKEGISIAQVTEDQEARIRTMEKHLYAERQLTQTLEEALTDLERQSKKSKADCDAWKKRTHELEEQVKELKERPAAASQDNRWSLHAVEEERKKRQAAEAARKQLEERMNAINKGKKKKGSLNCF